MKAVPRFGRSAWAFVALLALVPFAAAAQVDLGALENMKARSVGPAGQGGRINAIDVVVSNPDIVYLGAAAGGVFRSTNAGTTWEPIFDDQPVQSIGSIAVDQTNPDVIWVGTGEGNPRNSVNHGNGVYKSIDGGETWRHLGLERSRTIHRILLHPRDPDVAYLAVLGSPFGDSEERGVYRTRDGGESWERVLYLDERTGAADLVMDPSNPDKLIAAMWSHRREPSFMTSGGPGSGIHVTYDGGDSWTQRTAEDGLPEGEFGRIGLAIAASRPEVVYALVEAEKSVLVRSEDGGRSFETVNSEDGVSPRPFYYSDIFVDPTNENRLYRLASPVDVSEDGGRSFEVLVSGEFVHVDHQAWWIHPDDPTLILNGNDGGAGISRDRGRTWQVFHNLPVGQFYHVNVDMETPYNIYGGAQDNDSFRGPAYHWRVQGIQNHEWENLGCCADGLDIAADPRDGRFGYTMWQGGTLLRYDRDTGALRLVSPTDPEEPDLRFNWNAALALDPLRPGTVYFGSQFLHVSSDDGSTWRTISPDLTTNDPERQRQRETGGLTIDDSSAENNTTIVAISASPVQQGVIWVGTDDGNVQVTRDDGATWVNTVGEMPDVPEGAWVPQVRASYFDAAEAYVVVEDHRRDDWTPYVYHTTDYGASWDRIAEEVDGYALAVEQDVEEPSLLFLGTDRGLWVSFDRGARWQRWMHGMPAAPVRDLVVHPREHDLVMGTFGRSFYVLDDIRPLRAIAREGAEVLTRPLRVHPVPQAYQAQIHQQPGAVFPGHNTYMGENRPFGARISYALAWPGEAEEDRDGDSAEEHGAEEDADEGERVTIEILDGSEVIRTFDGPAEAGLQRVTWGLNRAGVRPAQRPEPDEPGAAEPGGPLVLPGTYTVRVSFEGDTASVTVDVLPDPRVPFERSEAMAVNAMWDELLEAQRRTTDAADRIRDAEATVERIVELLGNRDDEVADSLEAHAERTREGLEGLMRHIEDEEIQGFRSVPTLVTSRLGSAAFHLRSGGWARPTQGARRELDRALEAVGELTNALNDFVEGDWARFREAVEAAQLSFFGN